MTIPAAFLRARRKDASARSFCNIPWSDEAWLIVMMRYDEVIRDWRARG